jgi:hypothetical protein
VKGILVDPVERSVEYIVSEGEFTLSELHRLLGAEAIGTPGSRWKRCTS